MNNITIKNLRLTPDVVNTLDEIQNKLEKNYFHNMVYEVMNYLLDQSFNADTDEKLKIMKYMQSLSLIMDYFTELTAKETIKALNDEQ